MTEQKNIWVDYQDSVILMEMIIVVEMAQVRMKVYRQGYVSEIIDDRYVCLAIYDDLLENVENYTWIDGYKTDCKPVAKIRKR